MYNSLEVAWKMLQIAKRKGLSLSNLQLQKLVYIAHGYMLGWQNKALISDNVEAWNYGPVISSVYHGFKHFGDSKIEVDPNVDNIKTNLDSDGLAIQVIDGVLNLYGHLDAMHLVNLTHQPDTPWYITWNEMGGNRYYSFPIDNEIIKNHYRKVIVNPQSVGGL